MSNLIKIKNEIDRKKSMKINVKCENVNKRKM